MSTPVSGSRPRTGRDAGQAIISASADGIVLVGDDGYIRFCNPAAGELFGRPADHLLGGPFGFPIVAGRATEVELMLPDGGERIVEMRVTSTLLDGEHLHVAALRDVTRRRRLEQDLERALERQHATAAVVAHELRSPLAAIRTLTDVLRDPAATLTPELRADVVDRIAERTAFLQSMVAKLLTAARIDEGVVRPPLERVPLLELTLERLADFGEQAGEVAVTCDAGLVAHVNRDEMSSMLVNCLENAFAYGRPPIKVSATGEDDRIELRISDSGPGVPEDFVPRLFDRFAREPGAGRRTEGSGLGLWIVRCLARANGGEVRYEPGDHGGACFCISLRRARDS
ncbi:PAS domain-containing sensor histidine kinase [Actinoallomurus acaciae]|uniref:histidine kinase n=1 Tax=Actinoallomurus acaciae TaxID=502577 RepID=A0ABV5YN82_9ACTN